MITDPSQTPLPTPPTDVAWEQVEALLDEISQASRSDVSPVEFNSLLLDRLMRATAAVGGAIWTQVGGKWVLEYQINLDRLEIQSDQDDHRRHVGLLASIAAAKDVQLIPPQAGDDVAGNPTQFLLILVPLVDGDRPAAIVEIFQRPEPRSDLQQGYRRLAVAAAEVGGDFYRDRRLRQFVDQEAFWIRFRDFSEAVHASLDLAATADTIANEGSRLLGCDRLGVAVRRGQRYRLVAINAIDTIQRRGNLVRRLERLIELVLRGGQTLSYPADASDLPPEIETALDAYLDEAHVLRLTIHPLQSRDDRDSDSSQPLGALVVEQFKAGADAGLPTRLEAVAGQATTALGNALEFDGLPLIGLSRMLRGAARALHADRLPWTLCIAGLLLAVLIALAVIPADFTITARGELQPKNRHHIFAPEDGIVISLPRSDGDAVESGTTLAVLRSPALELQFSEVEGRRRTVQEQLLAVQAARMRNERSTNSSLDAVSLSAQEKQLQQEQKALDQQFLILTQRQRDLEIRSPIAGQLLSFDLKRLLADRPVRRGDRLMTVADLEGPWELKLKIDDDQVGHVLAAWDKAEGRQSVSFLLIGQPGLRSQALLREIGTFTEIDDAGRAVVTAFASIEDATPSGARPGTTVIAKIDCGRRPIGYVWFRAVLEAIQSRLLF